MSNANMINVFLGNTARLDHTANQSTTKLSNNHSREDFEQKLTKAKDKVNPNKNTDGQAKKEMVSPIKVKNNDCVVTKDGEVKEEIKTDSKKLKEDDFEKDKPKKSIENQIYMIMSETLQIPIEEIKTQLEKLGLDIKSLLTEEGFGQFINEVIAGGDVNTLLSGEMDIQKFSELFEQLSDYKELIHSEENLAQDLGTSRIDAFQTQQDEVAPTETVSEERLLDEVLPEEVSLETVRESKWDKLGEENDEMQLSFQMEDSEGVKDIGITVPIHHFTTTTFTQTFETEAGTITQTTTRQTVNGKAFIEQVDFKVLGQTREINVALSPKELGHMNIKIAEHNGVMVAEIKVDNEKAKGFILNEINELKNSLEEQGLNVAEVKVDVRQGNHQSQMEQERQKSSKRIQEIISKHFEENSLEEEVVETPIISDSEVDYMV